MNRSKAEIIAEIDRVGKTPPDWYDGTLLRYPDTLDLSWPEPAPKEWDSSKNVGQFIWDRINPNESKWREGVRLMHHILSTAEDPRQRERAGRHAQSEFCQYRCGIYIGDGRHREPDGQTPYRYASRPE